MFAVFVAYVVQMPQKHDNPRQSTPPSAPPAAATPATPSNMGERLEANMICGICHDIMYKCVSLVPCLHSFCGPCYSGWMVRVW